MRSPTVYLVRHGEVANPRRVIYASLPGFGLSELGRIQARRAGKRLQPRGVSAVITSPLQRATETAALISRCLGVEATCDRRLREWDLSERWRGTAWEELDARFPGEAAAYLDHPHDLPFTPEPLDELAARVATAITEIAPSTARGAVALVSHQDPIQAARLTLTGRSLRTLQSDKPGHGSIVTLKRERTDRWRESGYWEPQQGRSFPPASPLAE